MTTKKQSLWDKTRYLVWLLSTVDILNVEQTRSGQKQVGLVCYSQKGSKPSLLVHLVDFPAIEHQGIFGKAEQEMLTVGPVRQHSDETALRWSELVTCSRFTALRCV